MSTQQIPSTEQGIPFALAAFTFLLIILLAGLSGYVMAHIW